MGEIIPETLQSLAFGVAFACILALLALFLKAEAAGREEAPPSSR